MGLITRGTDRSGVAFWSLCGQVHAKKLGSNNLSGVSVNGHVVIVCVHEARFLDPAIVWRGCLQ